MQTTYYLGLRYTRNSIIEPVFQPLSTCRSGDWKGYGTVGLLDLALSLSECFGLEYKQGGPNMFKALYQSHLLDG